MHTGAKCVRAMRPRARGRVENDWRVAAPAAWTVLLWEERPLPQLHEPCRLRARVLAEVVEVQTAAVDAGAVLALVEEARTAESMMHGAEVVEVRPLAVDAAVVLLLVVEVSTFPRRALVIVVRPRAVLGLRLGLGLGLGLALNPGRLNSMSKRRSTRLPERRWQVWPALNIAGVAV